MFYILYKSCIYIKYPVHIHNKMVDREIINKLLLCISNGQIISLFYKITKPIYARFFQNDFNFLEKR